MRNSLVIVLVLMCVAAASLDHYAARQNMNVALDTCSRGSELLVDVIATSKSQAMADKALCIADEQLVNAQFWRAGFDELLRENIRLRSENEQLLRVLEENNKPPVKKPKTDQST